MKTTIPYSLLAAIASCGLAVGAETAYTTPVGYVSLGDTTPGQPAIKANTDSSIAVPLSRPTEFAGAIATVGANSITLAGTPNLTPNQFTSVPYWVMVKSGGQDGLLALVTANTADTLSLSVVVGNLASVVATDKVVVSKAWTLATMFPLASIPNGTQLIAFDGLANGTNLPASQIYTKSPTNWVQIFGGSGVADNAILYPGESFIMRTGATVVQSLVVSGEVPTTNHKTIINKNIAGVAQDTRLSYFSPVGEAISMASIPASNGDQMIIFDNAAAGKNKAASIILTKSPSNWVGIFGLSGIQDSYKIGSGVGYIYRRGASAPVGNITWTDQQTYIPSL